MVLVSKCNECLGDVCKAYCADLKLCRRDSLLLPWHSGSVSCRLPVSCFRSFRLGRRSGRPLYCGVCTFVPTQLLRFIKPFLALRLFSFKYSLVVLNWCARLHLEREQRRRPCGGSWHCFWLCKVCCFECGGNSCTSEHFRLL
jgi:hypothetical protein